MPHTPPGRPANPNPHAPWRSDRALLPAGPRRPLHSALAFVEVAYRTRARRRGLAPNQRRALRSSALLLPSARTEAIRCHAMACGVESCNARDPLDEVKKLWCKTITIKAPKGPSRGRFASSVSRPQQSPNAEGRKVHKNVHRPHCEIASRAFLDPERHARSLNIFHRSSPGLRPKTVKTPEISTPRC